MADALTYEAIHAAIEADLPGWSHVNGGIEKTYDMPNYPAGLAYASAVGIMAESINHHPDLTIGYKKVTVRFTTHDSGNVVTQNDLGAAVAVEGIGYPRA